jgi:hypothetical protein
MAGLCVQRPAGALANEETEEPVRTPSSNAAPVRNLRIHPETAFSRFAPLHRVDLEGKQRVDMIRSPSRQ